MNDFISKGDQARADILDAARYLFITQGFHGTSMRAIARAAGDRAVAGLYNHFPSKDAIFEALIEERNPYDDLFRLLEAVLDEAATAPDFVRSALGGVLELMPRHYDFIQLAQIDMREFEGRNMQHLLDEALLPRMFALIQRMQALPGLKPLDPVIWMRMMASLVIGFMVTDQIAAKSIFGRYPRAEWADRLADALLYGIAAPEAR